MTFKTNLTKIWQNYNKHLSAMSRVRVLITIGSIWCVLPFQFDPFNYQIQLETRNWKRLAWKVNLILDIFFRAVKAWYFIHNLMLGTMGLGTILPNTYILMANMLTVALEWKVLRGDKEIRDFLNQVLLLQMRHGKSTVHFDFE